MCGICGKLNFEPGASVDRAVLGSMLDSIRHRGPDDDGAFFDSQFGMGQRRLSIIDLSTGHQPLSNEDETIWIVFNGEIYNYRELRAFLIQKGHVFKTQTDTEVIVHLYEELGPSCLEKLRGMFAFAIWDQKTKTLFLARDRVGIKPLYYSVNGQSLWFASEIKAILADPAVQGKVSPQAIDRFLTFLFLPGAETLFANVSKLPPGHYLLAKDGKISVQQYWDLEFTDDSASLSVRQAEEKLHAMLSEAVELHMIADVPVGILLSGGVDSTAMLSYAVEKTDQAINSYTIGFSEPGIADERPYAKIAAQTFGAHYHDMTISARDFVDFMPRYVWHMEEPVCEPPAVAMYYVSKLARQDVKVLISGEGGDEAFAGYSNYRNLLWLERAKRLVKPLNGFSGKGLAVINSMLHSERVAKYVPLMDAHWPDYYYTRVSGPYRYFNSEWQSLYSSQFAGQVDKQWSLGPVRQFFSKAKNYDLLNQMLYVDTKTWLPDDLLIKADKMTMANSLELRVPLLDHKILEFAASLPSNFKVHNFTTKFIAKRALSGRVPRAILDRRKAGFPVPYEMWLRKDLRDWVHDLLLDSKTVSRGYFKASAVEDLMARDQKQGGYSKEIFSLATLELWHRSFAP